MIARMGDAMTTHWRMKSPHKYRAKPTMVDGIRFDSKKEAERYKVLKMLEKANKISHLKVHPIWPITFNGVFICDVELDFSYGRDEEFIYEDCKGVDTPVS